MVPQAFRADGRSPMRHLALEMWATSGEALHSKQSPPHTSLTHPVMPKARPASNPQVVLSGHASPNCDADTKAFSIRFLFRKYIEVEISTLLEANPHTFQ
jgi:hypothetical protein